MRSKRSTYEATKRFSVSAIMPGAESETATFYGVFFVADRACTIKKISAVWEIADTDAGTLDIEKLTGVQASGAGVPCLGAPMDCQAAANTVLTPALTGTGADLILAAGDKLNLLAAGVGVTDFEGLTVTVDLEEGI